MARTETKPKPRHVNNLSSCTLWHTSAMNRTALVAQMVKNPRAGDPGSSPGLGRSPGDGNGYPLQYSWLENSMGRGAWRATVPRVAQLNTTEWLTHTQQWKGIFNTYLEERLRIAWGETRKRWEGQKIEMTGKMLCCMTAALSISALAPKLCVLLRSSTSCWIQSL